MSTVNERGLYEIMFRTNSPLSEQFKDEIYGWLKKTRLELNIIKNNMIDDLEEEIKEINKEKEILQT